VCCGAASRKLSRCSPTGIETEDGLLATAAIRHITDRVDADREISALRAEVEESREHQHEALEVQRNQLRRLGPSAGSPPASRTT
jgi:hypothetical protein